MKAMCGHDPVAYEYLQYWFGFLLAYPAEKSSMPNIIGKPGAGKTEMLNFIIALIGESRCLVTSKPQDDVWGSFNSLIANKYLVILEELSEKQTIEYEGIIKDLITGGRLTINTKGVKQYKIDSYLKFVALSNTITCKSISGDRRNVLINCSDEFIGNSAYFTKLREYQADRRIQMLFYERILQLPDLEVFRSKPIPITKYQKTIQNSNREDYDLFMETWITSNTGTETITMSSKTLYDQYVSWVKENDVGVKASSHKKFVRNLILLFDSLVETSLKTSKCNMISLNIPAIMAKYEVVLNDSDVDTDTSL
jgi:phage/plasmid-associated DNA primase